MVNCARMASFRGWQPSELQASTLQESIAWSPALAESEKVTRNTFSCVVIVSSTVMDGMT